VTRSLLKQVAASASKLISTAKVIDMPEPEEAAPPGTVLGSCGEKPRGAAGTVGRLRVGAAVRTSEEVGAAGRAGAAGVPRAGVAVGACRMVPDAADPESRKCGPKGAFDPATGAGGGEVPPAASTLANVLCVGGTTAGGGMLVPGDGGVGPAGGGGVGGVCVGPMLTSGSGRSAAGKDETIEGTAGGTTVYSADATGAVSG
jgi:hypothetical protein